MSDDLLERATAALRETTSEPAADLERARARARLLAGARRRAGLRPQTLWQWAAVILAGFFVSTAMAHFIAVQAPRIMEALRPQAPEPPAPKPKPARRAQPVAPATPDAAIAAPEVSAPPAPAPVVSAPAAASDAGAALPVTRSRPTAAPKAKPIAPAVRSSELQPPSESPELALFRRAQALHLARDPRAIEAWDAYLRAAEHGPLVPEAQYNRALGLVRAGRYEEARVALSAFAQGAFGSYRQREAQALLARLAQ